MNGKKTEKHGGNIMIKMMCKKCKMIEEVSGFLDCEKIQAKQCGEGGFHQLIGVM
jgi:hypothetical protein